ncbi:MULTISPECIES: 2-hydroxychromene-2-carboxylate isomerase [Pseudomonas]|uniref:2-hydroxychromene-2-carboxylate isomerase n=1 Tax=Pseudomonas fluorescens TaxID=294 RepID=A0A944E4A1_PSEFL|nr:2-hydroxychromene-2-carboxylate isomerase [Pseudomonas fluorescens]MBT2294075.1 2-hydroxychromene-2-carboxylate isomerase [Pseudomonas fluorescens]MBT2307268.1 2-hydroxychromene-2-carboxylate isomerase [Pseudomonas fluorescens]MBT2311201.1 2-hydroxychromene-2-carboxylate isomerase [Pseudomonas fluorescens]MBT2319744.1 2-hydroxychromene-2-carboxylate isomerase [Pseudomonas fluorescens]MBT2332091.1 2-hydroxychromene-2-carboxylate isomerase [Pseudomonas fluorescens]
MSKSVEFFFDLGSPTTYLAYTQLPTLCAQTNSQLIYRPMLLGGVFKATGNASPVTVPAKGPYLFKDLNRFAHRYGVDFKLNPHFPINTLLLMRAVTGMQLHHPERFEAFIDCLFRALWVDGRNLNDPATVAQVLNQGNFDPDRVLALTSNEQVKEALKITTEEAIKRGVFGAPSMFVGDELFFGQDRLDFVREALG